MSCCCDEESPLKLLMTPLASEPHAWLCVKGWK